jgi:ABC-type polysaccharide/polyol phosphate export permease
MSTVATAEREVGRRVPFLSVDSRPQSRREWLTQQWRHREVLWLLARSDFHVRYKRASLGVLWAVVVPATQAASLAFVFSYFVKVKHGYNYAAFAAAAVLAWGYLSATVGIGSTAIVDGSGLTDKVWFPRSLLVFVPCLANLPGFLISVLLFLPVIPLLGGDIGGHTLLLVPAVVLLVAFCTALSLVLAALHVYFRDVKYLVQAALLVLFYLTPVAYPQRSLKGIAPWMDFNPLTGLANVFHLAAVGHPTLWAPSVWRSIAVTVVTTCALIWIALEVHRRYDRLFVDLL